MVARVQVPEQALEDGCRRQDASKKVDSRTGLIDAHVGKRMRMRRIMIRMSQQRVADRLGIALQQVRKYECGTSRIGAARLMGLSHVLDVPISFFFDDLPEGLATGDSVRLVCGNRHGVIEGDGVLDKRETFGLVRSYYRILDPVVRKQITQLIDLLSSQP